MRELQFQIQIEKQRYNNCFNELHKRMMPNGELVRMEHTHNTNGIGDGHWHAQTAPNYALKNQYVDRVGDRSTEQSAGSSHEHLFFHRNSECVECLASNHLLKMMRTSPMLLKSESDNRLTLELLAKEAARPSWRGQNRMPLFKRTADGTTHSTS